LVDLGENKESPWRQNIQTGAATVAAHLRSDHPGAGRKILPSAGPSGPRINQRGHANNEGNTAHPAKISCRRAKSTRQDRTARQLRYFDIPRLNSKQLSSDTSIFFDFAPIAYVTFDRVGARR